jgi:hypothetical protein
MMSAQEAFRVWLLQMAAIAGGVVFIAVGIAVFVVAMTTRKRDE